MSESKIGMDGENAPENGSFAAYFTCWHQRRHKEGYMEFTGGRLGKQEKAKQGHF